MDTTQSFPSQIRDSQGPVKLTPQIKKNQQPTPEQRILSLERRITELERKLAEQTRKLSKAQEDIKEIKLVCNRLHKTGKRTNTSVSFDTPATKRNTPPNISSNGTDTAKG